MVAVVHVTVVAVVIVVSLAVVLVDLIIELVIVVVSSTSFSLCLVHTLSPNVAHQSTTWRGGLLVKPLRW